MTALVLSPSEADRTTEEGGGERGTIHSYSTGDFEMILTMLTKMVAIHVGFFEVGFQGPNLEWTLSWL